jgi:DNA-binding response OmpR family regulator
MKGLILLVDDEYGKYYQKQLEERGYLVLLYQNGRRVIDDVNDGLGYDVALLDCGLPDIAGDDIVEELFRNKPHSPIICFSLYEKTNLNHVSRVLPKPVDVDTLERVITGYLGR